MKDNELLDRFIWLSEVKGSGAIAVLNKNEPNNLVAQEMEVH